jgi:hypothetical protein
MKTGFEVLIDGKARAFRDRLDVAHNAARYFKSQNPKAVIEIVDRKTGQSAVVRDDGRLT